MFICCLLGIPLFSPSLSQHFSSLGILKNRNLTFSCGEPSLQPLTLMARPAGVNFSAFRSLRQSSPIKEVRCCRHSAWPCDAAMCKRLFPLSSWILSRLSAARCGCTNRKMKKKLKSINPNETLWEEEKSFQELWWQPLEPNKSEFLAINANAFPLRCYIML